jgi:uncharacterized protein (TIGR04255 family)
VKEASQEGQRSRALLDIDFHVVKRFVFDIEELRTRWAMAHAETDKAFRTAVTEHALSMWR